MKILSLIPRIMAVEPAVNWSGTKTENTLFIYPFEEGFEYKCLEAAEALKPDFIIMFAFGEGPFCPNPDRIRLIKAKFPIVYIATDGACRGLWPTLRYFKQADCFTKTVNIDGSYEWPEGTVDLVTLSPLDQKRYQIAQPFHYRAVKLGFMGGQGAEWDLRRTVSNELISRGVLTLGGRDETWGSAPKYTDFMLSCQAVINFPQTGLGNVHVKARALETGLAGALLLEHSSSILKNYFIPDEEYFEWNTCDDVVRILELPSGIRQSMANRYSNKVYELTNPDAWVEKVAAIL